MREEGEGRSGVGFLGGEWDGGVIPNEVLSVVHPNVSHVFCSLRGILEATEENYVVLVVSHSVTASGWRRFALGF